MKLDSNRKPYFEVAPLIAVLQQLPEGAKLYKSQVGTIVVFLDGDYIGYVDLHTEQFVEY